ncbi:MAG: NAD-dependent epimerase/dehydratase family protein [Bacteriovoracaceae bacterium]
MSKNEVKKILIIGAGGGLARITSRLLLRQFPDVEIIGIDNRDVAKFESLPNLTLMRMKYTRGNFENLFRDHQFDLVYHLARISHSSGQDNLAKRLDLSVMGTSRILDLCLKFNVKKVVVLSTHHVYGAFPDNSVFLQEDAPLRASIRFPELRDVVEMDQIATNWMWKNQKNISTIVLRPCNIIGAQINNTMSQYLTNPYSPYPIDFNPKFQFIHEFDMANILVSCLDKIPVGIYNVATDEFIAIREAMNTLGTRGIPFPMTIGSMIAKYINVPEYLVEYLKFSCLIDNSEIKKYLGEDFFRFKIQETLKLIRLS